MEVMYADPNDYVEQLKEARENDDTEVVHYAVTALAELQKDYETKFQKLEWRLHKDPGVAKRWMRIWNCCGGICSAESRKEATGS